MTADFRTEFTDRLARKRAEQVEDYCFDCKKWIDTDDVGHQEHDKLSNRIIPLATLDWQDHNSKGE